MATDFVENRDKIGEELTWNRYMFPVLDSVNNTMNPFGKLTCPPQ